MVLEVEQVVELLAVLVVKVALLVVEQVVVLHVLTHVLILQENL